MHQQLPKLFPHKLPQGQYRISTFKNTRTVRNTEENTCKGDEGGNNLSKLCCVVMMENWAAVSPQAALSVLIGGGSAAVIASFVNNGVGDQLLPGIKDVLLTVGAPTAVGILAVRALDTQGTINKNPMIGSLLAGGISVGLMIAVGALPATVDSQTLALIVICGGGAYIPLWLFPK